jgi:hypothetical protein
MAPHASIHHQQEPVAHRQQQGLAPRATAGQGSPAVVSLKRELSLAVDAVQPLVRGEQS